MDILQLTFPKGESQWDNMDTNNLLRFAASNVRREWYNKGKRYSLADCVMPIGLQKTFTSEIKKTRKF